MVMLHCSERHIQIAYLNVATLFFAVLTGTIEIDRGALHPHRYFDV